METLLPPGHPFDDVFRILIGLAGLGASYVAATKTWRFLRDVYRAWKWVGHTKDEAIEALRDVRAAALLIMHEFNSNGGRLLDLAEDEDTSPEERERLANATMKDLQRDNRALLQKVSKQLGDHDGWARQDALDQRRGYAIPTETPRDADPDLLVGSEG